MPTTIIYFLILPVACKAVINVLDSIPIVVITNVHRTNATEYSGTTFSHKCKINYTHNHKPKEQPKSSKPNPKPTTDFTTILQQMKSKV